MTEEKLCIFCEHLLFYPGAKGYSEYTPPHSGELTCKLGYFSYEPLWFDEHPAPLKSLPTDATAATIIQEAENCPEFEWAKGIEEIRKRMRRGQ